MDIKFKFIGWCNTDNADKVWVSFSAGQDYYAGWGRRGAKLQFKKHSGPYMLGKVEDTKRKKYQPVDEFLLFSVFPDFKERVEQDLVIGILSDKVK